jgi:hypothetical protein
VRPTGKGADRLSEKAKLTTFLFIAASMLIAIGTNGTGVVIKIVVDVVAATVGVIGIPLILGLLPWFRRSGPTAALSSVLLGLGVWATLFITQKTGVTISKEALVSTPIVVSTLTYVLVGLFRSEQTPDRDELIEALESDEDRSKVVPVD